MKQVNASEQGYLELNADGAILHGNLIMPSGAKGLVVFAHGSGSSRHSPRNQYVAGELRHNGLATMLFDLLTLEEEPEARKVQMVVLGSKEEAEDLITREQRFDIDLLFRRLVSVTDWLESDNSIRRLRLGYFGASTGAAAALAAAAERVDVVGAVVSRGGRPDLAAPYLNRVRAPTLLIVGGNDFLVIEMNRHALEKITAEKKLQIVPHATHLFEEPGALEKVAALASDWFIRNLALDNR